MADQRMEALARTQHGLVTTAQAFDLGLTENGIWHRVRRGRLHRVLRGIYRLPGALELFSISAETFTPVGPSARLTQRWRESWSYCCGGSWTNLLSTDERARC